MPFFVLVKLDWLKHSLNSILSTPTSFPEKIDKFQSVSPFRRRRVDETHLLSVFNGIAIILVFCGNAVVKLPVLRGEAFICIVQHKTLKYKRCLEKNLYFKWEILLSMQYHSPYSHAHNGGGRDVAREFPIMNRSKKAGTSCAPPSSLLAAFIMPFSGPQSSVPFD